MVINIILIVVWVALAAWLVVRGITLGWTTSTVVQLGLAVLGVIDRLLAMRRDRKRPIKCRRCADDLLRIE